MADLTVEDIASRCERDENGCLVWQGATDRGYGRILVDNLSRRVHRVMWELSIGPIPSGLTIDHLCRNRACADVLHMEVVTIGVNVRRAVPFRPKAVAPEARKTHCRNGHEYTSETTTFRPDGTRRCRTCRRAQERAQRVA